MAGGMEKVLDGKDIMNNKKITVAIAGNPNSGKTSLLNAIAGTNLKVGNWSGVTVEKYEAEIRYGEYSILLIDLPGTYSLNAYSPEEKVARDYISSKDADVILNVVDGTSLERSLYLSVQLLELEPRVVMALNMYDDVEKSGIKIDFKMLQKLLGCHVVPVSAVRKTGIDSMLDHIVRLYEKKIDLPEGKISYSPEIERAVDVLMPVLESDKKLSDDIYPRLAAVKLLENDNYIFSRVKESPVFLRIEALIPGLMSSLEKEISGSIQKRIAEDRHAFVRGAYKETVTEKSQKKKTLTDYIDSFVLNRLLGLPFFLFVMWLIFQMTFTLAEAPMQWIESFFGFIGGKTALLLPAGVLRSIIVDGVIAGVGGVLVFLPNILLLFFGLSFLEATGYMARAAFVVDKVFHKIGLHGKSFIPMITGFGCSVPAFMACRTLKNRGDRLATMMVIPFMSCGAKLPVYVLLIGAFFPVEFSGNMLFGVYLFGILIAMLSAKLFKSTVFRGQFEPFVMELPVYRMPTAGSVMMQMWIKAWMYIKKAGTMILFASLIIWLATNYPVDHKLESQYDVQIAQAENMQGETAKQALVAQLENEKAAKLLEHSAAGKFGKFIEPVIKPLGFDWRIGVALTAGLAAKEVVVSTMGTIYSLGDTSEETAPLEQRLKEDPLYNTAVALSLIVFVLLYVPCLAATAVFHKEAGGYKITLSYIAYSMITAWVMSFIVYRIALLCI